MTAPFETIEAEALTEPIYDDWYVPLFLYYADGSVSDWWAAGSLTQDLKDVDQEISRRIAESPTYSPILTARVIKVRLPRATNMAIKDAELMKANGARIHKLKETSKK